MYPSMFWTVGLDLRAGCDGPIHFAAWLTKATATSGTGDRIAGVHVIEETSWDYILRSRDLWGADHQWSDLVEPAALLAASREAMATQLDRTGTREHFSRLHVLHDTTAETGLCKLASETPGSGLVIGRRAPTGKDRFIRLGRAARRILRRLPSPVIVTPPDLQAEDIGNGPIVVAADCSDDSIAACKFGQQLARRLGTKLCLIHVVPMPRVWVQDVMLQPFAGVHEQMRSDGATRIDEWLKQHQIEVDERVVEVGDVTACVEHLAHGRKAPLIVCGSRQSGPLTRVFVGSVASELAASARCSVAVVPPDVAETAD